MFYIDNLKIDNRVIAAPLAGVTDRAYRMIVKDFGCGLVFTEMISDMGLIYGQTRTRQIADTSGEIPPVAVQIFGSQAETMAQAASIAEDMGADIIDINMGCPTPKIVKSGEGAALMLDIPKSREIIKSVAAAVKVPVTVKMRKGWDDSNPNCVELAQTAQEAGAKAVTIHPRSRMQFFSGLADWDIIREVKKVLSIPVIGNGDIWEAEDALRMIDHTGCDAVMIGRAAMGNPFIFRETVELLENGRKVPPPTQEERLTIFIKHLELVIKFKGEGPAIREMRKHFAWYIKGMRGAAKLRAQINQATTRQQMIDLAQERLFNDN